MSVLLNGGSRLRLFFRFLMRSFSFCRRLPNASNHQDYLLSVAVGRTSLQRHHSKVRHVTSASFESISMAFFLFPLLAALSSCPSSFHSFVNEGQPQQVLPTDYRTLSLLARLTSWRQRILHFQGSSIDGAVGWTHDGQ